MKGKLSKENFLYMKILANRCGIELTDYKREVIYNRLTKRLRALQLPDFDAYCAQLRIDLEEETKFINLITNPTTSFFRENHHFENLAKNLPALIAKKKSYVFGRRGVQQEKKLIQLPLLFVR